MENGNKKTINVSLTINNLNEEVLIFKFDNLEYELNFVSEDQTGIRNLFKSLLENIYKFDDFEISYSVDEQVKNDTIKKVAKGYVDDLEKEIKSCILEIKKRRNENEQS